MVSQVPELQVGPDAGAAQLPFLTFGRILNNIYTLTWWSVVMLLRPPVPLQVSISGLPGGPAWPQGLAPHPITRRTEPDTDSLKGSVNSEPKRNGNSVNEFT